MIGPFLPLATQWLYNWARPPVQKIENSYKYLLEKRAATCEMEKNAKKFNELPVAKSKEFQSLQALLKKQDITLYQLE